MVEKTPPVFLLAGFYWNGQSQTQKTCSIGQINTHLGQILVWLYDEMPHHKAGFIQLANTHIWDSLGFNRVVKDFVA